MAGEQQSAQYGDTMTITLPAIDRLAIMAHVPVFSAMHELH